MSSFQRRPRMIETQPRAAQQCFRALIAIARLRQHELEARIRDSQDANECALLRVELARTRNIIARSEEL